MQSLITFLWVGNNREEEEKRTITRYMRDIFPATRRAVLNIIGNSFHVLTCARTTAIGWTAQTQAFCQLLETIGASVCKTDCSSLYKTIIVAFQQNITSLLLWHTLRIWFTWIFSPGSENKLERNAVETLQMESR